MKINIWSKTILSSYKYLNRVCNSIDKLVEKEALNTSVSTGQFVGNNTAFNVAEKKRKLIKLKILIEKSLTNICKENFKILINKYVNNKKSENIYKDMNISRRTYFRKLNKAVNSFSSSLIRFGYDYNKLEKMLEHQKWINDIYFKYDNEEIAKDKNSLYNERKISNAFVYGLDSLSLFN